MLMFLFFSFENTDVSVHSSISTVFIITKYLDNWDRDKTVGTTLTRIY